MPTPIMKNGSPYQVLHNQLPHIDSFKFLVHYVMPPLFKIMEQSLIPKQESVFS